MAACPVANRLCRLGLRLCADVAEQGLTQLLERRDRDSSEPIPDLVPGLDASKDPERQTRGFRGHAVVHQFPNDSLENIACRRHSVYRDNFYRGIYQAAESSTPGIMPHVDSANRRAPGFRPRPSTFCRSVLRWDGQRERKKAHRRGPMDLLCEARRLGESSEWSKAAGRMPPGK